MAILKLKSVCKEYLWGGERLRNEFDVQSEAHPLAEAWVLSCHRDGPSVIENGPDAGLTLQEYIKQKGKGVLGNYGLLFEEFPILIKLIDAQKDLSIQVHPPNLYAMEQERQYGKTEAWYIVDAEPDSFLYYGFRGSPTRAEFLAAILDGTLTDLLNAVPVHAGDLFFIPAGTIHAIGKGILVAEIQQNSNVTYRVYDYGRMGADGTPRMLHIKKALDVTHRCPPQTEYNFGGHLARCEYFTLDHFQGEFSGVCDDESFTSLLVLDGVGTIACGGQELPIDKGKSLFLPAQSGAYHVTGTCSLLQTRVGTI